VECPGPERSIVLFISLIGGNRRHVAVRVGYAL
jgi:hypothetical protein